jgi:hypothetical protein
MSKTLNIEIRNVYGKETVYPACDVARTFAGIAGTKTLSHGVLIAAEKLGFEIVDATPRYSFTSNKA